MRFQLTVDQERFRSDLCQFLQNELTAEIVRQNEDLTDDSRYKWGFVKSFRKRLAAEGYVGMDWPVEHGGGDKDMVYQVLYHEEMDYHNAPGLTATYTFLPPAIMLYGTEEQKQEFLPRIRRGEIAFFLGYSEPEAGSDLANLQCHAVLEGDEFVINGQKLFSTTANHADYAWLAVRTDPDAPKHRGISLLIVDMKSPGISLDWYKTMAGWWHHGVHFDNVRVPRSMLVGELNRGWYHIMGAIDYERASIGNPGQVVRQFDQLLTYCRQTKHNGGYIIDGLPVRNLLADLAADVRAARLTAYWVASMHAYGEHPQHETSLAGLFKREAVRRIQVAHLELMGPYAQLSPGSKWAPLDGHIERGYRNDMLFHFAAGGFDITRNVIAGRGLGLPRD